MIDTLTQKPIQVHTDGDAGPYLMVPVSQLDEVRALLDQHDIVYCVDEDAISLNGKPEIAVIDFGRNADAHAIQQVVDRAV